MFIIFSLNNDTFIEVKLSLSNFLKLITSNNFTQLLIKLIEHNKFDILKYLYFTTDCSFVIIGNISWINIQLNQVIEIQKRINIKKLNIIKEKVIYSTNRLNLSIKSLCSN